MVFAALSIFKPASSRAGDPSKISGEVAGGAVAVPFKMCVCCRRPAESEKRAGYEEEAGSGRFPPVPCAPFLLQATVVEVITKPIVPRTR